MGQTTICMDYDDTYTKAPELMEMIISKSKALGYRIILCTMRCEDEEDMYIASLRDKFDAVYFTSRMAKKPYLEMFNEYPDIWIDD